MQGGWSVPSPWTKASGLACRLMVVNHHCKSPPWDWRLDFASLQGGGSEMQPAMVVCRLQAAEERVKKWEERRGGVGQQEKWQQNITSSCSSLKAHAQDGSFIESDGQHQLEGEGKTSRLSPASSPEPPFWHAIIVTTTDTRSLLNWGGRGHKLQ